MIAVREGAMRAIFHAKSTCVGVVNAHARLVVTQMITSLCITRGTMQKWALVPIGADASGLVVLGAIIVGAIIEGAVPLSHRPAPPLVHKVPVEAREGSVLRAFALYEERTLLDAEFFQVCVMIRLFRLSCQQRFRVGLHLGYNNASRPTALAHKHTH